MALSEIADFVVNVFQLINYLLKISIFIGKLLVEVISHAAYIVWKILQAIGRFMVVFYEDYSYFVEDFRNGLSSIAMFFIECLTAICGGVVKAVGSTGNAAVAGYHGVRELLSGRLLTVPIFTVEFVKQVLVIVGDGVWFLVTLPGHLVKNFWEHLDAGLEVAGHFSRDVGAKSMEIGSRLGQYLVKDVPLQSAAGIFILILAYMNPKCSKRIAKLCFGILLYFHRKMLPYGRGIRRKYLQCKQQFAQLIEYILVTVLAAFVYLQTRAITIYDTEARRIASFFRNFFALSDRRRRGAVEWQWQQRQQHLSRIENRRDHSGSEQSSRSSSASSDQSTQSRSQRTFAQNSSSNSGNNGSPSKKGPEGSTTIGLCIICEDNEKAVVLVPCGHMCLCKRCADQLGHYDRYCPICRTLIHRKVDVFI